jgi:hypothetical protein
MMRNPRNQVLTITSLNGLSVAVEPGLAEAYVRDFVKAQKRTAAARPAFVPRFGIPLEEIPIGVNVPPTVSPTVIDASRWRPLRELAEPAMAADIQERRNA